MYGDAQDIFKKKENAIVICNHQCTGKQHLQAAISRLDERIHLDSVEERNSIKRLIALARLSLP